MTATAELIVLAYLLTELFFIITHITSSF